jgi:large subunit ribosomal protein L9
MSVDVILLQNVMSLGNLGDRVSVKAGYARNYLIPSGCAITATPENLARFEERRAELEKAAADARGKAALRAEALSALSVTIRRKAGEEGRLFGSVTSADIARAVTEAGVDLERREVRTPEGPFRRIGEFEVDVHLHSDVDARLKLLIEPEQ